MVSIMATETRKFRTFGWVQDSSDFRSLCNVVAVFDKNSMKHKELVNELIPRLVLASDGREDLISALNVVPLKIKYSQLVGKAFKRCNSIIQATVKGQRGRSFIRSWPADNFIRWAYCLGFIKYDYTDDTFEITEVGLRLTSAFENTAELSVKEKEILTSALLSYPPAIRVLSLLSQENTHLTKFEIGRELGFIGEGGFGSMPQNTFIRALSQISDNKEKNKMKADWEGASDKYARMIARWLANLGLVEQVEKTIFVKVGKELYSETLGQAYMITAQGITALNKAMGKSRHPRIRKNICFEMLATKGADREYLRTRRALIIKHLTEIKKSITVEEIHSYLTDKGIEATLEAIRDDIIGLVRIGLSISFDGNKFSCCDKINSFVIPLAFKITESSIERTKDELRERIKNISKEYLSLIDLAYEKGNKKGRNCLFEMKTLELLTDECGYEGTHLGGSRKPDGVIYTATLSDNYGVIIDTKAYSNGYNLPIQQADEMQRYIQENQRRDETENPNKWWENFGNDVEQFHFMFVSGHFKGQYQKQIDRIMQITKTSGAAVAIGDLILMADRIKGAGCSLNEVEKEFFHTCK